MAATPIPVTTASAETKNWRTFVDALTPNPVYAVKIPMDDLTAIMTNAADGMRVYGALKIPGDITSFHVYVVAVDANGNDIVTVSSTSAVYDTCTLCPPTCGGGNALNS